MKTKLGALAAVAVLALGACSGNSEPATGEADGKTAKIALATFVSHPALDAAAEGFKEAMKEAGWDVTYDEQNAQGEQATLTNIANSFATSDADGFFAIATPTAQSLANVITDKPIVFAAVTDPVSADLVESWDAPGRNVTGVSDLNPMADQLELIREVLPDAKKIGIVYSSGEVNSEVQVKEAEKVAGELGFTIEKATVTNSAEVAQAAESMTVDAQLIITDNTVVSAAESVIQVAEQRQVPVFGSDEATMERGAAAGLSVNYTQQGRDAAAVMIQALEGKDPATIPVTTQEEFDLFVNPEAAKAQGLELPEAVVGRATKQF